MSDKKQKQHQPNGFTLIELLVVISIIVMLLGILVPGMQAFKRTADNLKQKSRFHSMEVALELYQKDFREYPESQILPDPTNTSQPDSICGAHRLAEALLGRDIRGFDTKSNWYAPLDQAMSNTDIYAVYANGNGRSTQAEDDASQLRRKGPYMDIKDVGAFNLNEGMTDWWYTSSGNIYAGDVDYPAPVFSDIFYKKVITVTNLESGRDEQFRVGTPVLYFKANEAEKPSRAYSEWSTSGDFRHLVYNYEDNEKMFELPVHDEPTKMHRYNQNYVKPGTTTTGIELFYEAITNEKVAPYLRPVNARGFLLMSAGRDGIFGTKDDVTNFGK